MAICVVRDTDSEVAPEQLADNHAFVTELSVPAIDNTLHWHSFDAQFYITDGDLILTDEHGKRHPCGPGCMVTVPARTLHREYSRHGYQIVFGASVTPDQFGDPVNRAPETLA